MEKSTRLLSVFLCLALAFGMVPITWSSASAATAQTGFTNAALTVASEKESTLAPGITQGSYTVYDENGDQVKMFVTTADMSVDTVKLFASYKNMDPTNYGMSKLTEQVASFNEKAASGDEYYQGTVVAGINASYYNMITGKPTGTFVMNGVDVTTESEGNAYGYFAVMKDGSVKIGNAGDYSEDKGNIQEAIGIYRMLIVDGEIVSGLDDSTKYPRQTIGITADGDVVLMTADGNQAPKSVGLTVQEQAEVMLDLGCVWAGHLDGGGSCTYAAKAEGSSDFSIVNSPSDGSERSISNGFIMVSTAVSDGKFSSASLTAENEYVTPGSTVKISAVGVDKAGSAAEIPVDVAWQVEDASLGTVVDGVFTASNQVGEAVVQMTYGGEVVGETTINVVVPDSIAFGSSEMVVPYGKSVAMSISAKYGARDVALKTSDIVFDLSDATIGTISGFDFTASSENDAVTSGTLTAKLSFAESVTTSITIKLGKGSEVIADFENGSIDGYYVEDANYNYVWPESWTAISTSETGQVHSGSYSFAMNLNYANSLESGYMRNCLRASESRVFDNAVRVGMWIYIPDECVGLWARWTIKSVTYGEDGSPAFGNTITGQYMDDTDGGTGVVYTFDEPGWHYLSIDTSDYGAVGWKSGDAVMQFYISDRDGSAYNYVAADNSNIPSNYRFYIDDITVDYSTAVDDREAPKFSNVTYATEGMPDAVALDGQTISTNKVTIAASVAENTTKSNYTGIDASTVKAYIDGVEVKSSYENGKVTIEDAVLANGKHTIKFSACDKMGNYGYIYRYITVAAETSVSTVKLVPADSTLNRIPLGSIYNFNLVTTAIEEVQSVEVAIDLDNNSAWQLDHMTVPSGFEATYTVDDAENIATIAITRTGANAQTGEAALATLPVRVWTLKTGYTYENGTKVGQSAFTLAQFKNMKEFWRMSVVATVDKGVLTRVDNSTDTFTGERVFCDTEMWANYANMTATAEGLAYYNEWDGGHVHSASAIDDKDATCSETGYTDRTFCESCNSVVDWGVITEAKGHDFVVSGDVIKCACGELFDGIYDDGKTYVDGVVVADGWNGDSYYKGGVKLTGLQEIDGLYYDFGTEGVCANKARVDGFFYDESVGAYRYFTAGQIATGEVTIYPEVYFYDESGVAISGEVDVLGYSCLFDEKGAFVSCSDASVVDAGFSGTNIEYVLLSDGLLKVDGEGVMKDYSANGLYPAWITKNEMSDITAIEIGSGITKIGKFGFFRNGYVRSVTFAENSSLETIGWGAFGHCWRLVEVTIPASVKTLEEYAFYECGALERFSVEDGSKLKTIKDYAFQRDRSLKTVFIPDSVSSMGTAIFYDAGSSFVLQVAEYSVAHNYALQYGLNVELREGALVPIVSGNCGEFITWELYPDGKLVLNGSGAMPNYVSHAQQPWANYRHLIKKVVIGKDVTSVGNYAFAYSQNVESVFFEEGSELTSVGILSFMNLPKLTSITLPDTVTYIGAYALGDCFKLASVYIPQGTSYIYHSAFNGSSNVVLNVSEGTYAEEFAISKGISYTTRDFVYVPVVSGSLTDFVSWSLYENGELWITGSGEMPSYTSHTQQPWANYRHLIKKVVIGKDVTSVGNYAFAYSQNVTEVEFEEGSELTSVGILSFMNLPKLTSVVLPDTVTYIGAYALGDCFKLASVYIPQGTSYIYHSAFNGSSNVVLNVSEGTYAEEFAKARNIQYTVR